MKLLIAYTLAVIASYEVGAWFYRYIVRHRRAVTSSGWKVRLITYDTPAQRILDCLPALGMALLIALLTIGVASVFTSCDHNEGPRDAVAMEASDGR